MIFTFLWNIPACILFSYNHPDWKVQKFINTFILMQGEGMVLRSRKKKNKKVSLSMDSIQEFSSEYFNIKTIIYEGKREGG